jgi:hypothetical protein
VALHVERDRIARELEQARVVALNQGNIAADPNRPLREYTAPKADEIHLEYTTSDILVEEYQIPPV